MASFIFQLQLFHSTDGSATANSKMQRLNENLTFINEHLPRVYGEAAMVMNTI